MKLEEIHNRLNNLRKRGLEGYAAKEDFQAYAESDIEYLLAIIEQAEKALECVANSGARETMRRYAEEALKAIREE